MLDVFLDHRPVLLGVAYRMLGSVAEAEDVVQDVYVRWQKQTTAGGHVASAQAWLTATTTRLCIDRLRSARRQREEYVGVWLPEPILDTVTDDRHTASLADSLTTAFLLMLEALSPDERAVLLLHEAFEYSHAEIAAMIGIEEANCRQLLRRARERLGRPRPRHSVDEAQAEAVMQRFLQAARTGDLAGLLDVLSADATLRTDGGGRVRASPTPIAGADRIGRFLLGIRANLPPAAQYTPARVNGGTGVVVSVDGRPFAVLTFAFDGQRICDIYSVSNPDKLRHVAVPPRLSRGLN